MTSPTPIAIVAVLGHLLALVFGILALVTLVSGGSLLTFVLMVALTAGSLFAGGRLARQSRASLRAGNLRGGRRNRGDVRYF